LTIDIHLDLRNSLIPLSDDARIADHLRDAEVLARALGDQHRIGRIATFMAMQCVFAAGNYEDALRFAREALIIARTLDDRSMEMVAKSNVGLTHIVRGEFRDAISLLEGNATLEGDLRFERFGTAQVVSARSEILLSHALTELGCFDRAVRCAEDAVRVAETADHPYTLFIGLFALGGVHLSRGDIPRAMRVLERALDFGRTWQFAIRTSNVAAALGTAYALAACAEKATSLIAPAVAEFRCRQNHYRPAFILLCAGRTCLLAGRADEAADHAREALAITRQLGARGYEAHALCLTGDIASTGGADDTETCYRGALGLAEPRGMRPLVAHCQLGLGKLYRRQGNGGQAEEHLTIATSMYREMNMTYWQEHADAEMRQLA
jgi:tetratricopeptide (TPR) repeat protein